jgi:hypothetical protein
MSASVVAELSYQWRDFGKYTSPALQFLDLEGRVTALEKELRRAQKRASNAHRQAI